MQTVQELYRDVLQYEEEFLTYYIYCLLQEGKISLTDSADRIEKIEVDWEKFKQLRQENVLGLKKIKTYSLKMDEKTFCLIFAENRLAARLFFYNLHPAIEPLNCLEYDFEELLIARDSRDVSLRDLKKECTVFPTLAGYYWKGYT